MSNIQTAMNGARATAMLIVEAPATGMITLRGDLADAGLQKDVKSVMGRASATLAVTDADAAKSLMSYEISSAPMIKRIRLLPIRYLARHTAWL